MMFGPRKPLNRQSRVRLAQILIKGPDLIVLDNVLSALDLERRHNKGADQHARSRGQDCDSEQRNTV